MILNRFFLGVVALCSTMCLGYGQILLQPGQTLTYAFTNLPFSETVGVANATPGCALTIFYQRGYFTFEMFANSTDETPFVSSGAYDPPAFWYGAPSHWQDLQGVVRLTAITDSVIDRFRVDAYVPRGSVSDIYSFTVIPEPSSVALLALGGLGYLYNFRMSRKPASPLRLRFRSR